MDIYDELVKKAQYAINSKSRNSLYEVFGMVKMARKLQAITKEEFFKLNDIIVVNTMNNAQLFKQFH